jgi:hypothetical protein
MDWNRIEGNWPSSVHDLLTLEDEILVGIEPAPLVVVQRKLLDGHSLSSLAIGRLDRAEIFAFAAHDDDAPASQFGCVLNGLMHLLNKVRSNGNVVILRANPIAVP